MAYKATKIDARLAVFQKLENSDVVIQGDRELEVGATIGVGEKYSDVVVFSFEGKPTVFVRAVLIISTTLSVDHGTVFYILPKPFFDEHEPEIGSAWHLLRIFSNLVQLYLNQGMPEGDARERAASGSGFTAQYAGESWTF